MTREQLFEAIGALDEAMLDQNVDEAKPRRHFGWITGIAACAALIAGVMLLPHILPQGGIPSQSDVGTSETTENTDTTEFAGFLEGVRYYPLPEGSSADAVCADGAWLAPELGRSAYFVLNEAKGLYQFVDPLSSALPETGTYTIKDTVITAVSYDGGQEHTLQILDGYALELTESSSWEQLTGRIFTSRYNAEKPFADAQAEYISNLTCNDIEITLDDEQMEILAAYLRNVIRYQAVTMEEEPRVGGISISFTLTKNGKESHIGVSNRLWMDGTKYLLDQESCNALFDLLIPLAEEAQNEVINAPKTLPYLHGVTYRQLEGGYRYDTACSSMTAAFGFTMQIELRSGNYRITYLNPAWEEECGIYTIEDGFVICTDGENTHQFEIMDDYSIRFASSTNENITSENFKDRIFTCRLNPERPFAALSSEQVKLVIYSSGDDTVLRITPDTRIMEAFLACAAELVVYKQELTSVTPGIMDTEQMQRISIVYEDSSTELLIGDCILLNGKSYLYETDTADALYDFFEDYSAEEIPDAEQESALAVFDSLESYTIARIEDVSGKSTIIMGGELETFKSTLKRLAVSQAADTEGSSGMTVRLTGENAEEMTVIPDTEQLCVNGTWYECSDAKQIIDFCQTVLEAGTMPNSEIVKPDASSIAPIPVTNEVGSITKELIYGRCLWTFKYIQQLSGMTKICGGKNYALITEGSFRFDLRNDLYYSEVFNYLNDGTNAITQHDQRWKEGDQSINLSEYEDDTLEDHIMIYEHDLTAYDENGNFILAQGSDPTNAHDLGCCCIPYEISRGYLKDKSRWEMLGTAKYQGRECVVIEGEGGNYGERYGVESFILWVDLETGVWMFFEGYDADGNVNEYVYTKYMRFDADALQPKLLSDSEFQALSEIYPVKIRDPRGSTVEVTE